MPLKFLTLALAASATVSAASTSNDDPCVPCKPQGATGLQPPAVGSGLSSLYVDVLGSVKDIHFKKRALQAREEGFCCRQSLNCVNVQSLNIPMCYDKFTTNFAFADGSYGSLTTGQYMSGGASVNLFTGDYSNGNEKGNIYANNTSAQPNTATLSIPPQFTGTGIGAPIPASELGSILVFTTTIPGTTYTAATTVPETVMTATVSGQVVQITEPATTITGPTTIAPHGTTVTQHVSTVSTAGAYSAVDTTRSLGMAILGFVTYVLYAL